jgi:hypothetical protein
VSLLERAVSLLDDDDPARRELSVKLGIALAETGQLSRAGEMLSDRIQSELRGSAFVVFHDRAGKEHVVNLDKAGAALSVGRRDDNDIALPWDGDVSRRHAQLQRVPEGWVVLDDGSRNGSYLNGKLATGPQPLRDGDVLRFGDTVVLFRAPGAGQGQQSAISLAPDQATRLPRPSGE